MQPLTREHVVGNRILPLDEAVGMNASEILQLLENVRENLKDLRLDPERLANVEEELNEVNTKVHVLREETQDSCNHRADQKLARELASHNSDYW